MAKKEGKKEVVKGFTFSENEMNVLKNFANINSQVFIDNDGFRVISTSESIISSYKLDEARSVNSFGVYDANEFLSTIGALNSSTKDAHTTINVEESYVDMTNGTSRVKYSIADLEQMPRYPQKLSDKIEGEDFVLEFKFTAEKLNILFKVAQILKLSTIVFETDGDRLKLVCTNELENVHEIFINEDFIKTNNLDDTTVKLSIDDLKMIAQDYNVKISKDLAVFENGTLRYVVTVIEG